MVLCYSNIRCCCVLLYHINYDCETINYRGYLTNKSLIAPTGSSVVLNVRLTTVIPAGSSSLRNVDSACRIIIMI